MPQETTEGLGKNGIWFWHDFPRKGYRLADDWRARSDFPAKYRHLWARFAATLMDNSARKHFLLSNSQSNLDQFAPKGAFAASFGLDAGFRDRLLAALDRAGVQAYRTTFLIRDIEDYLSHLERGPDPRCEPRFVGVLDLPHNRLATISLRADPLASAPIEKLAGTYDNGARVAPDGSGGALVVRANGKPWAVARPYFDGFVFAFARPANSLYTAVLDGDALRFSNRTRWLRTGA